MANLDHDAIMKAYPEATCVDDFTGGAFKEDGTPITLVQSEIDAARAALDSEAAALAYQGQRKAEYPSIEDQLDTIYHSGVAGWKTKIKAIKDKYPKP